MTSSKVKDIMKPDPILISPDDTLQVAAQRMKSQDCGMLPVGTKDRVQGIITDRDIVIRAVSEGKNPATEKVRNYMTAHVCSCKHSDTLQDAADKMSEYEVSRLVVLDGEDNLMGVLTFGSIIRNNDDRDETSEVVDRATGRKAA